MRLERFYKVPASTWFATVAGSAFHEITEEIDRATLLGLDFEAALALAPDFQARFDELLAEEYSWGLDSDNPKARARYWRKDPESGELQWIGLGNPPTGKREVKPSGKPAKSITEYGGPNKKDYDWWLQWGPIYLRRYINWRQATGYEIARLPDGRPGIELDFKVTIGTQQVVGAIDRVFFDPATGTHIVVDLKSGKEPSGSLQLMTYYLALLEQYDLRADWALFWTPAPPLRPRTKDVEPVAIGSAEDWGKASDLVDTDGWALDRLRSMFDMGIRGMRAGVFLPTVTNMCTGCTVKDYCWAVKGKKAGELPAFDVVVERASGEVVFDGTNG